MWLYKLWLGLLKPSQLKVHLKKAHGIERASVEKGDLDMRSDDITIIFVNLSIFRCVLMFDTCSRVVVVA